MCNYVFVLQLELGIRFDIFDSPPPTRYQKENYQKIE
jgi:hypothetical protein